MKNEAWRRNAAAYPQQGTLQPRITDVDHWQHLNNVAQIGLHGELLQQWLLATLGADVWRGEAPQLAMRANATDFLAEAQYPAPLATGVRLLGVEAAGFTLGTALFQHGHCTGLHQATLGVWQDGRPAALTPELRATLQATLDAQPPLVGAPAPGVMAEATGPLPPHPDHWPAQITITARFADADARGQTSDFTLARCVEQGRVQFLSQVFGAHRLAEPVGFMVAHVALHWRLRRAAPARWQIATGVQRVGARSLVVTSAVFDGADCLAEGTSVMVVIDHATRRPAALQDTARVRLAPYLLPGA